MSDNEPDVLNQLREELASVTPSPAFAASVRTRVGTEAGARKSALVAWILPGAVAAAAVVVVAVVWQGSRPAPEAGRRAPQSAPAIASTGPAAAVAPSATAVTPSPTPSAFAAARVRPIAAEVPAETKVEVITNQGRVLRTIWARVPGPLTERPEAATEAAPNSEVPDITVDPIQVEPIVVRSLDQPGPGSGSGTIIRRVAADATGSER